MAAGNSTGIDAGITITGDITATEDITIGGQVNGRVTVPDYRVTIGPGARIKATIVARSVVVSGRLDGTVVAGERVHLLAGSEVRAHLTTPSIHLADGATFTGTVDPSRAEAAMHVARYRERHGAETPDQKTRPA